MDKLPLYESYKEFILNLKLQFTNALQNKEFWFLTFYTIFLLVVIAVFISGVMVSIGAGIDQWNKWHPISTTPPKTLTYQKIEEKKNEYGQINTVFDIQINTPFGNPNNGISFAHFIYDAECSLKMSNMEQLQWTLGLASTTNYAAAYCTSTSPIIDTGKLFRLNQ